jgi:hypothetical protein|tara:strand:+ start:42588 stop:42716 length:129 start_codon:yes stop_codon:yes gene_type:complete
MQGLGIYRFIGPEFISGDVIEASALPKKVFSFSALFIVASND